MRRATRSSVRQFNVGEKSQNREIKTSKKTKQPAKGIVEVDSGSDSDTSSGDEFEDIVSATLSEFTTDQVNQNDSDSSESDSDDSDEAQKETAMDFIIDKTPVSLESVTDPLQTRGSEKLTKESTSSVSDNRGLKPLKEKSGTHRPKNSAKRDKQYELATELDPGIDTTDIYVTVNAFDKPKAAKKIPKSQPKETMLKGSVIDSEFEKKALALPYEQSRNQLKKQRKAEREKTNGKGWFHMPVQEMTEEKKNDLMVIQMRRVLDPKRFYKGPDIRALPKFFQMGRVVEGPADFYHSRIPKKQRKATLVDELLEDVEFRRQNKKKYAELVEQKKVSAGAYKHMKRLKKKKKR